MEVVTDLTKRRSALFSPSKTKRFNKTSGFVQNGRNMTSIRIPPIPSLPKFSGAMIIPSRSFRKLTPSKNHSFHLSVQDRNIKRGKQMSRKVPKRTVPKSHSKFNLNFKKSIRHNFHDEKESEQRLTPVQKQKTPTKRKSLRVRPKHPNSKRNKSNPVFDMKLINSKPVHKRATTTLQLAVSTKVLPPTIDYKALCSYVLRTWKDGHTTHSNRAIRVLMACKINAIQRILKMKQSVIRYKFFLLQIEAVGKPYFGTPVLTVVFESLSRTRSDVVSKSAFRNFLKALIRQRGQNCHVNPFLSQFMITPHSSESKQNEPTPPPLQPPQSTRSRKSIGNIITLNMTEILSNDTPRGVLSGAVMRGKRIDDVEFDTEVPYFNPYNTTVGYASDPSEIVMDPMFEFVDYTYNHCLSPLTVDYRYWTADEIDEDIRRDILDLGQGTLGFYHFPESSDDGNDSDLSQLETLSPTNISHDDMKINTEYKRAVIFDRPPVNSGRRDSYRRDSMSSLEYDPSSDISESDSDSESYTSQYETVTES